MKSGMKSGTAQLVKCAPGSAHNWFVEYMHGDLYQATKPLNRNEGKKFLELLAYTLPGPFFHQIKGGGVAEYPIKRKTS